MSHSSHLFKLIILTTEASRFDILTSELFLSFLDTATSRTSCLRLRDLAMQYA
jgi:hypothetical protein